MSASGYLAVVIIFMRKTLMLYAFVFVYCAMILNLESVPFPLCCVLCAEFTCLNTRNIPGISKTMTTIWISIPCSKVVIYFTCIEIIFSMGSFHWRFWKRRVINLMRIPREIKHSCALWVWGSTTYRWSANHTVNQFFSIKQKSALYNPGITRDSFVV